MIGYFELHRNVYVFDIPDEHRHRSDLYMREMLGCVNSVHGRGSILHPAKMLTLPANPSNNVVSAIQESLRT